MLSHASLHLAAMSPLYLILGAVLLFACTASAGDVVSLDSLMNQCRFMVDGNGFDLCPMFERQKTGGWLIEFEQQRPPSILTGQYRLMIDGKLPKNESLKDDMQCPDGTAICLTTYTRYSGAPAEQAKVLNTIPVAGALGAEDVKKFVRYGRYNPGLNAQAEMVRRWNATEASLRVKLHGGYYVYEKQSAVIDFVCEEDHSNSIFRYLWTNSGDHYFVWKSPHACVQSREGNSPTDTDNSEDEQNLVSPPIGMRTNRAIWALVAITTTITAIAAYLIYFPPRLFRKLVSRYLKNHPSLLRFRVGENVLVRWAHDEIDLDGEEPLFIDGDDINHYVDDEEGIPLKPSPRKVGFTTYGTA
ncbi:hypothetical protein BDW22DRAFT_1419677 [Trametopsis cervina]|nr:hypothetical protein BDW22DRAFT_1419677 [Trametopsis cervina]